ncbi:MAG: TonB-dependent receptor [Phenylobacterium sp.]|nr:MAG: TonB-dependent receptor [Phenylobacterium sp.]
MKITPTRERLLASSMICGVALLGLSATQASAQATTATNTGAQVSEIVVTGSRIPQPNLTSVSPLSVVNSQEVKLQGATAIESVLQNLPSVVPEFNQGVDNGATGTATVSLRGLSSKRTLVLVNGYRLMPGDPIVPTPDLNNIPAALVERVEVVTGGASAVYGSDAVAGVVNFILNKDFEGFRVDSTYGFAVHNNDDSAARQNVTNFNRTAAASNQIPLADDELDAKTWDITAIIGTNAPDGKGNITAYASYRRIEPLPQSRRDAGACGISTSSPTGDNVYDTHICQGSSNSAFGHFATLHGGATGGPATLADNPNGTNTFVPFTGALAFNFGPFNYYQQDDERYTAGYFAHYEVTPQVDVYSDLMFADDRQRTQAAGSGLFTNSGPVYQISCNNPFMSASQAAALCGAQTTGLTAPLTIGYRFSALPRLTDIQHTAYSISLGARGKLSDDWTYDLHAQYGDTLYQQTLTGDVSIRKLNQALNAVAGPNGPVCVNATGGCVPINIFTALDSSLTPAALSFVEDAGFKRGSVSERIVSFNVTGDLAKYLKSPWANDGVGVNLGTEYRSERLSLEVSSNYGTGDLSGSGGANPPGSGGFDVYELFGEARVPLVQDMPFIQDLSLELGYRFADYSSSGTADAYKISGDWSITPDIRLRGGFNRAVRAPNITELFTPQTVGLGSFNDPCAGTRPAANCARTFTNAALAAQFLGNVPTCAAAQCSQLLGGNPNLKPEEADTYTVGFVTTPRFLPGFNASVDYFNIKITNPIVPGIGGALILSQCLTANQFCSSIHRDPTNGSLFGITTANGYVINTEVNSGSIKTSGVDFTANYRYNLGDWGGLAFQYLGTYTQHFITEPVAGLGSYDCAGFYGVVCGEPVPKYKSQARVTWTTPWQSLQVSANWRYLGSVKLDLNQSNDPFLAAFGPGVTDPADAKISAFSYFDLAATYRIKDTTFRVGVNNVFDKNPPIVDANTLGIAGTASFGNGNTFPGVYDAIGRTVFVGLTADF